MGSSDTLGVLGRGKGLLGHVLGEDVLGTVEILAELVIVNLSGGAKVAVLANEQVENTLRRGHETKSFQNTEELVGSYVEGLAAIKVLEIGLEENAVGLDD